MRDTGILEPRQRLFAAVEAYSVVQPASAPGLSGFTAFFEIFGLAKAGIGMTAGHEPVDRCPVVREAG